LLASLRRHCPDQVRRVAGNRAGLSARCHRAPPLCGTVCRVVISGNLRDDYNRRAVGRDRPRPGEEASLEVTVTDEMLVNLEGRRIHPLYATAWMVRHVEEAGRRLIEPHLRAGEDATGYAVSVVHERPARQGDLLTVSARATRVDEHECEAAVEVIGPRGRVGAGTLVQRYIAEGLFRESR
jgi:fluoroacetyl-CoA thioesterase